jgi:hypothetical protein
MILLLSFFDIFVIRGWPVPGSTRELAPTVKIITMISSAEGVDYVIYEHTLCATLRVSFHQGKEEISAFDFYFTFVIRGWKPLQQI